MPQVTFWGKLLWKQFVTSPFFLFPACVAVALCPVNVQCAEVLKQVAAAKKKVAAK